MIVHSRRACTLNFKTSIAFLSAVKNAKYGYAFIADIDLVHKNIWPPPHDPLSCSRGLT
jgi:hypothetical protein